MSTRYILITQCLQNDFFLNTQCKLCLPFEATSKLLIGDKDKKGNPTTEKPSQDVQRELAKREREFDEGPLGRFLKSVTSKRKESAILHMVNIRDWHRPSDSYDVERAKYGAHCEEGSWGAEYINGLSKYLDPRKKDGGESGVNEKHSKFYKNDNIRVYHVYSDSIFDFRPRNGQEQKYQEYLFSWNNIPGNDNGRLIEFLNQHFGIEWIKTAKIEKIDGGSAIKVSTEKNFLLLKLNAEETKVNLKIDDSRTDEFVAKVENSKLNIYDQDYIDFEDLMDVLVLGTDEQINELDMSYDKGHKLAENIAKKPKNEAKVYIAVIGVYTDIKIQALLMGLVSRYNIGNLAISDTLTASSSIERHLGALDFANKLLNVEVISGINNLIGFLGGEARKQNEPEIVAAESFSNYAQYFQDKQNVLAHNDVKLNEYLALTQKRSKDLYQTINRANQFLLYGGITFLALTIIAAVWALLQPGYIDWRLPAVTGGISLSQFVTVFFGQPMAHLQKNLTNFANFRMILEGHSFKMAVMRFHLTTAETLRGNLAESGAADAAETQVRLLEKYIKIIDQTEKSTYEALSQLGLGDKETIKIETAERTRVQKK